MALPDSGLRRFLMAAVAVVSTVGITGLPPATAAPSPAVPLTVGGNASGQLGRTAANPALTFGSVAVPAAEEVAAGRDHNYALTPGGAVWAWGENELNQVGDGSIADRPVPVSIGLGGIGSIAAGHYHGLAVGDDGRLWSWGYGGKGQLGSGSTANRSKPAVVAGVTGVTRAAGGRDMSYAVTAGGAVWGWGANASGEVGDGTTTTRLSPVRVAGLPAVSELAAGRNHALAVDGSGRVWAWGDNAYGQVGDGTTTNRPTPKVVLNGPVVDVAAGAHHSAALLADGRVLTWGSAARGQLGLGSTTARPTPTTVPNISGIVSIGAARDNTYAVNGSGAAWAWGNNASGQVGDGTTTTRTAPVRLPISGVAAMEGGASHTIALPSGTTPGNQPPTASFPVPQCSGLSCSVTSTSSDPDGTIASHAWDWGDGSAASSGSQATHTYQAPGQYVIKLQVTDNAGQTATASRTVTVAEASNSSVAFRAAAEATGNWTSGSVRVPANVQSGDGLLLFVTTNSLAPITSAPAGWTKVGEQTAPTIAEMRTVLYRKVAGGSDAGSSLAFQFESASKFSLMVLAYDGTDATNPISTFAAAKETTTRADHTTPSLNLASPSWVVSYWADRSSSTTAWIPPADQALRSTSIGTGGGRITSLAVDSAGPVPAGAWSGRVARAEPSGSKVTMWSIALRPAP